MFRDAMQEERPDGRAKWSWFRIGGLIWFWVGPVGSAMAYYFKDKPISPEIGTLTAIILLGVAAGKGISAFAPGINAYAGGMGPGGMYGQPGMQTGVPQPGGYPGVNPNPYGAPVQPMPAGVPPVSTAKREEAAAKGGQ